MTVVGIDLGAKRIGLAVSDERREIAFPAGAIQSHGLERDLAAVCDVLRERRAQGAVVGLPVHMNGREGPEAATARRFAEKLAQRSGLPVEMLDERWTSREAERALAEEPASARKRSRRRREGAVDSLAATLLLRTFLERQRRSTT